MLKNVSAVTSGKEGIQKNVGREEDESVQRRGERVKQVNWNVTGNHAVLGIKLSFRVHVPVIRDLRPVQLNTDC
jgi:hypothetical protein